METDSWDVFLKSGDRCIGLKKEVDESAYYLLGIINLYTDRYFAQQDNEAFLWDLFNFLLKNINKNIVPVQKIKYTELSAPLLEEYGADNNLAKIKGNHIIFINNSELIAKGVYEEALPNPYSELDSFLSESFKRITYLPCDVIKKLRDFKVQGNKYGVLVLKGIGSEHYIPPTPKSAEAYLRCGNFFAEMWLALIAEFLGFAIGYAQEKKGNIFQNLVPHPKKEALLSSESSKKELDFHTEIAFHPHLCDYVLLYCLRQDHDKKAKTFTASARMIRNYLSLKEYALLFEPLFVTGIDYSYGSPNGKKGNGPITPIFHGNPNDPYMIYDLDLMQGINHESELLLTKLRKIANHNKMWVILEQGDLLIIDNNRCVHGRSEFIPRYDGKDRWILRTYVLNNIIPAASDINNYSRVVNTKFVI